MLLHHQIRVSQNVNKTVPIIMIHGLFGNLNNLGILSTFLVKYCNIIQIDLRNHGRSPHCSVMTYVIMAHDVLELLNYLSIKKCIVIGQSMGGKVAMTLGILFNQYVKKIVIIDIAPKKYNTHKHQYIFSAISQINNSKINDKNRIINILQQRDIELNIILFLLKSFRKGKWIFNFDYIKKNYNDLCDWNILQKCWKPSLFIRGGLSNYIKDSYFETIYHQFPYAYIHTVPHAGHWVHYDQPTYVSQIITKFIL